MLDVLISGIVCILAFMLIIVVHELGHFWMAKLLRVHVRRFSIGFGRPLLRFRTKQTEYRISAIPLGGYVKFFDEAEEAVPSAEKLYAFNRQPLIKRLLIVLAGPSMSLLLAVVAFWMMFMVGVRGVRPVIERVQPHSVAQQIGLRAHQEIISVGSRATPTWQQVRMQFLVHMNERGVLLIRVKDLRTHHQSTHVLPFNVWKLDPDHPNFLASLGIVPKVPHLVSEKGGAIAWPKSLIYEQQYGIQQAFWRALDETGWLISVTFLMLFKLITGVVSWRYLGGPITILQGFSLSWRYGFSAFLMFLGLVNISLGILNLLPIPVLDGGYLVYYVVELVTRRPVSVNVQRWATMLGMLVLTLIVALALFNDLSRVWSVYF